MSLQSPTAATSRTLRGGRPEQSPPVRSARTALVPRTALLPWTALVPLTLLELLASPGPARASGSVREVPLRDLVARSQVIVLAERATPFEHSRSIPICVKEVASKRRACPPFTFHLWRYRVVRVIHPSRGLTLKPVVEVASAEWRWHLDLHRGYHERNLRKIPIYHRYRSSLSRAGTARLPRQVLLFLARDPAGGLSFVIEGAIEHPSMEPETRRLLRSLNRKPPPTPAPAPAPAPRVRSASGTR